MRKINDRNIFRLIFTSLTIISLILFLSDHIQSNISIVIDGHSDNAKDFSIEQSGYWNISVSLTIIGNADWTTKNSTYDWINGAGTWSNPYIIENVTLNHITIEDSERYFIISNCTIGLGISIYNVDNGILRNNIINAHPSSYCGFSMGNSNNYTIEGNTLYTGSYGISISHGDYLLITDNTIISSTSSENNRGINVYGGYGNTISENSISLFQIGIQLTQCNQYNVINNILTDNRDIGICLNFSNFNTITGNKISGSEICITDEDSCQGNIMEDNECITEEVPPFELDLLVLITIIIIGSVVVSSLIVIRKKVQSTKIKNISESSSQGAAIQSSEEIPDLLKTLCIRCKESPPNLKRKEIQNTIGTSKNRSNMVRVEYLICEKCEEKSKDLEKYFKFIKVLWGIVIFVGVLFLLANLFTGFSSNQVEFLFDNNFLLYFIITESILIMGILIIWTLIKHHPENISRYLEIKDDGTLIYKDPLNHREPIVTNILKTREQLIEETEEKIEQGPCPYCGHPNKTYTGFCTSCGKNLKKPLENPQSLLVSSQGTDTNEIFLTCPYCGDNSKEDDVFCGSCGNKLE